MTSDRDNTLRPQAGARFLLERGRVGDGAATASYAGAIVLPERRIDYAVSLTLAGDAAVTPADEASRCDAELEDMLLMIARLTARGAGKRQEDGLEIWPRRVLRWRGPGR